MLQLAADSCSAALVAAVLFGRRSAASPVRARKPSEANHFIETPAGWTHPKTPWGDPDLQGMWPISFVGSVPLERCAGGFGRGRGTPPPPCDLNKAFLTEEEYAAQLEAAGVPRGPAREGDFRGQLRTSAAVRRDRPDVPAAADLAHRGPAERQAAGADGRGQAPVGADEEQLGAARTKRRPGTGWRTSTAGTAASRAACRRR